MILKSSNHQMFRTSNHWSCNQLNAIVKNRKNFQFKLILSFNWIFVFWWIILISCSMIFSMTYAIIQIIFWSRFHFNSTFQNRKKLMNYYIFFFKFVNINEIFQNIRIFNARFVNERKIKNTNFFFKKSRLIMQIYNDFNKNQIFIQSSII